LAELRATTTALQGAPLPLTNLPTP